jgi:hypothetical protein
MPTRPLFGLFATGLAAAALVLALCKANTYRLQARLEQLELVCIAEALNENEEAAEVQTPLCDPTTLAWTESVHDPYHGIQAEMVSTQATIWRWNALLVPVVSAILLLTAAPLTWRFIHLQASKLRKGQHDGMTTPGG